MTIDEARKLKPGDWVREVPRKIKSVDACIDEIFGELVEIEYDDGGGADCNPGRLELVNEEPFSRLHDWLEDDRDRRSVVIRSDKNEIWWVGLSVDGRIINAKAGGDLDVAIAEAMEGMVIADAPDADQ